MTISAGTPVCTGCQDNYYAAEGSTVCTVCPGDTPTKIRAAMPNNDKMREKCLSKFTCQFIKTEICIQIISLHKSEL